MLRSIATVVLALVLFGIVPEGLAIAWAAESSVTANGRGLAQALIMVGNPVGQVIGALVLARLVTPNVRHRLVRPLALVVPLSLVVALADPPPTMIGLMAAVSGFALGGIMSHANALFMLAVPVGHRARASGVMRASLQIVQLLAVSTTGALASQFDLLEVVAWWGIIGTIAVGVALRWVAQRIQRRYVVSVDAVMPTPTTEPEHFPWT